MAARVVEASSPSTGLPEKRSVVVPSVQLREEFAELRGELSAAREDVGVQRTRVDRAEARLDKGTVVTGVRRRQSYAGRGRRRDAATATGTERPRD
jgi:colicin import membrane protein